MKTIGIIALILLAITSCQKNKEVVIYDDNDLIIRLLDVEDTRCPEDAMCVWEGNAKLDLRAEHKGETADFSLNTFGDEEYDNDTTLWDYEITLNELKPYPQTSGETVKLKNYEVSLTVTPQ
jgi:hypothetical protein